MPKNQDLSELEMIKIIEGVRGESLSKDFSDYLKSTKAGKGPNFTADSKGGVKKNYRNGGAVMKARGGTFKGTF
jgi:hypothetical protein